MQKTYLMIRRYKLIQQWETNLLADSEMRFFVEFELSLTDFEGVRVTDSSGAVVRS